MIELLRRIRKTLVICLVLVALLMGIGLYLSSRTDWLREQLCVVIAQQIANRSGREVQVGEITGDLLNGIVVKDFAIAEQQRLAEGVVLAAQHIRLDYDLFAILRGKPPLACIQRVELKGVYAKIIRDEDGVINLTRIFPPPKPPRVVPPEQRFRGQVIVADSVIDYRDETVPTCDDRPLQLRLTEVDGNALISPYGPLTAHFEASTADRRASAITLDVKADTEQSIYLVDGTVRGLDGAWWYDQFVSSPQFALTGGQVDGRFTVWSGIGAENGSGLDYYASAWVSDATARVAILDSPVSFSGRFRLTPEGMGIDSLSAYWAGAQLRATGNIFDWSHLGVDLSVQATNLAPQRLLALLPSNSQAALPGLPPSGRLDANLAVVGPVPDLTITGSVESTGQLLIASGNDFRLTLSGLRVQATIPNLPAQAVAARVSARQVSPSPLIISTQASGETVRHTICISDLQNLEAELLYAGQTPVLQSTVHIEQASVDNLTVSELSANVQMAGRTVRVSGVQACVAGGEVVGQGLAQFDEQGQPTVYFDLAAGDLQLADLRGVRGIETPDIAGRANLLIAGCIEEGQPAITGRLRLSQPQFQGIALDELVAVAQWRGDEISLPAVHLRDAKGQAWAYGSVNLDGNMDLHLNAAELDLAAWGRQFNQPDLSGIAWLQAHIAGTVDDPVGSAQLIAFNAGSEGFATDALFGKIAVEQSAIQLEELLVARESAMLQASGRLAGLEGKSAPMPVVAELKVVGMRLDELCELANIEVPLSGAGEIQAVLSGTIDEPQLAVQIGLPYGHYGPYSIADAKFAVTADRDSLCVSEGNVNVAGATVSLQGQVSRWLQFLRDSSVKPDYSARLSVENIDLQAIISPEETDVALAGRMDLPLVEIHSTAHGPAGQAHLLVPELVVAGQQVSAIDTMILVEDDWVSLQDTTLQLADADIRATAGYSWKQQQASVNLTLTGGRLEELLKLAAPISKLVGGEDIADRLRSFSLRARGAVELWLDIQGMPADMTAEVQARLTELSFDRKSLPDISGQFTADVAGGEVVAVHDILADVSQGEGLLIVEGAIDPNGQLSLLADGSNFSMSLWKQWLPEDISLGGTVSMTIAATGPIRSPSIKGSLDIFNPSFQGVQFDLASIPILSLDPNSLNIDILLLKLGEQELKLSGRLPFRWQPLGLAPEGELKVSGKIENIALSFFPPLLDKFVRFGAEEGADKPTIWHELKARGQVDSDITIAGTLQDPVVEGYLRISDGKISLPHWSKGFEQVETDLKFTRQGSDNVIAVRSATAQWDNTRMTTSGQATLKHFSPAMFAQNEFDLTVDLQSTAQHLFGETVLNDLTGRLTVVTKPDRTHLLTIEKLKGRLGRGSVEVAGNARISSLDIARVAENDVDIEVNLREATVDYAPVYKGLVDGSIAIANPAAGKPMVAEGQLTLYDAKLAPPTGGAGKGGRVYGWDSRSPSPRFDMKVVLGPNVVLKTPGLTAPLQQTEVLWATGTPQDPLIRGVVEVEPGKATVAAGVVRITELVIKYRYGAKPAEYEPPRELALSGQIWGQAVRVVPAVMVQGRMIDQVTILIEIGGTLPDNINLTLSSRPPLSEEQLYQIMGTEPLGLLASQRGGSLTDLFSQQFTGLLAAGFRATVFHPIEEQIKQALGLDEFTVTFGFAQPLDISLGKYAIKNLLVRYRHSVVSDTEEEWDLSLSYELPRQFRVSFHTDEQGEAQFRTEYTQQF